jgi:hypothetical protein
MDAFLAYLLGLLTVLLILIAFYYFARNSSSVGKVYDNTLCKNVKT